METSRDGWGLKEYFGLRRVETLWELLGAVVEVDRLESGLEKSVRKPEILKRQ